MTQIGQEIAALELSHRFPAPREKVFEAWIKIGRAHV